MDITYFFQLYWCRKEKNAFKKSSVGDKNALGLCCTQGGIETSEYIVMCNTSKWSQNNMLLAVTGKGGGL
jgi:hypothetical protein